MEKTVLLDKPASLLTRVQDYAQLTKMRLASLVVFSAAMAYMTVPGQVNWIGLFWLTVGGFLVTGSANGFNQIIERDLDRKMDRTRLRPLPDLRISVAEAWLVCIVSGAVGIFILTYFMNVRSGLLGALAIVLYALVYTPMKKQSPFSVFVGAVPGAIPPLLGYVAATNGFNLQAWVLFSIQFIWQFPHFWAIAWVLHDDYKKAGFNLLPSGERDRTSAWQTFIYALCLVPVGFMPFAFKMTGWISLLAILPVSLYFVKLAWDLYHDCTVEAARKLMYGSFIYLPVVQIALVLDKIGGA
jgi:protoheme IX farnesyltransferase